MAFNLLMKSQNTATEKNESPWKFPHWGFCSHAITISRIQKYFWNCYTSVNDSKCQNHSIDLFLKQRSYWVPSSSRKTTSYSRVKQKDANRYFISECIICENNELTLSERRGGIRQILGKPSKTSLLTQLSQLLSSDPQSCYTQLNSSIIKSQD